MVKILLIAVLTSMVGCAGADDSATKLPAFSNVLGISRQLPGGGAGLAVLDQNGDRLVLLDAATGVSTPVSIVWDIALSNPFYAELLTGPFSQWQAVVVERSPALSSRIFKIKPDADGLWYATTVTRISGWIQLFGLAVSDVVWGGGSFYGLGAQQYEPALSDVVQWINYDPLRGLLHARSSSGGYRCGVTDGNCLQDTGSGAVSTVVLWQDQKITAAVEHSQSISEGLYKLTASLSAYGGTTEIDLATAPLSFVPSPGGTFSTGWFQGAEGGWFPVTMASGLAEIPSPYKQDAELAGVQFDDQRPYSNPYLLYQQAVTAVVLPSQTMSLEYEANAAHWLTGEWREGAIKVSETMARALRSGDRIQLDDFVAVVSSANTTSVTLNKAWPGGRPTSLYLSNRWVLAGELSGFVNVGVLSVPMSCGALNLTVGAGSDTANRGDKFQFFYDNGLQQILGEGFLDLMRLDSTGLQFVGFDRQSLAIGAWNIGTGEKIWENH